MGKKVYMLVSNDEYELPVVVADTIHELALKCNVSEGSIKSCLALYRQGKIKNSQYIEIEIDE